jgi:hypothetical protein
VLRLYRRQNTFTSVDFLTQIVAAFPFPIRKLQTACYERFVNPVSHRVPAPLGGPIE